MSRNDLVESVQEMYFFPECLKLEKVSIKMIQRNK